MAVTNLGWAVALPRERHAEGVAFTDRKQMSPRAGPVQESPVTCIHRWVCEETVVLPTPHSQNWRAVMPFVVWTYLETSESSRHGQFLDSGLQYDSGCSWAHIISPVAVNGTFAYQTR